MPHWDADQYLRYANERTQPAIDLLARVAVARIPQPARWRGSPFPRRSLRFRHLERSRLRNCPDWIDRPPAKWFGNWARLVAFEHVLLRRLALVQPVLGVKDHFVKCFQIGISLVAS